MGERVAHGGRYLALEWTPGDGGLVAAVPCEALPTLTEVAPAAEAEAVQRLHMTLLRSDSMAPLVDVIASDWERLRATLPPIPWPQFESALRVAVRGPKPPKDPPSERRPRRTWFLAARDQQALRSVLLQVVEALDTASRARGGPGFRHPEPARFFHVSLYNNRGGDPMRSIGDIGSHDL